MDNRNSFDQTLDSIDLTKSPVKHTNTQRHKENINEDTSDYDTDEMIDFDNDKLKRTYRKDTNDHRKRAKIVKTKKGRTTKIYSINIERKRLLKQRREKALQNTKDRKLAKRNPLAALKADHRANRASNESQSSTNMNNELIDGSNTDTIIGVGNTDNTAINAENTDNATIKAENTDNTAINAENTDNAAIDADNISNAATDGEKSDDAAMSDDNTDNTTMSNNNTDDTATGNGNTENTTTGETSMVEVPSPLCYGGKTKDPSKVKTSKRHTPIMVEPSEPSMGDTPPDEIATVMVSGHPFDPTDVHKNEFLIQGAPNPLDLEGVEEDQLLEIQ